MMNTAIKKLGMSEGEFWNMPFFMFVSLVEVNKTDADRRRNRKFVVDSMRYTKQQFGWN